MEFAYGHGQYIENKKNFSGRIILAEHKLYMRGHEGDIPQTYIPLEKITGVSRKNNMLTVNVRPSLYFEYTAHITGEKKHVKELTDDVVQRRGLKKRFLKNEWFEEPI